MLRTLIIVVSIFSSQAIAQERNFPKVDPTILDQFIKSIGKYKDIPHENIKVRKKQQLSPLTTVPSFFNLFRPRRKWKYTINISTKTIPRLTPILYDSLSPKAQIGVLSHELSHVHDFHNHNKGYMIKIFFSHLSKRRMDKFEFNTDLITIKQGMGNFLYAWSSETRAKLNLEEWTGATNINSVNERYMSPQTICTFLHQYPQHYKNNIPATCLAQNSKQ